jgi:hypothetical protein
MARLDIEYLRHVELTKIFTRLLIDDISNGNYKILKNPQNRSRSEGARFRLLFRPPGLTVPGNRRLEMGDNEMLLFIHGNLDENLNISLGYPGAKYRWAIGKSFGSINFIRLLDSNFSAYMKNSGRNLLESHHYDIFTKDLAEFTDRNLIYHYATRRY